MKHPLFIIAILVILASCSKKEELAPTNSPATIPIPTGRWVTDGVYTAPKGAKLSPGAMNNTLLASFGYVELTGRLLTVSPGIFVSSTASTTTIPYSLTLPMLYYEAQGQAYGRVDSILNVTATSFTWRRYGPYDIGGSNSFVVYATFHR